MDLPADWAGWWLTADQQGQRLESEQKYSEAAETYNDPDQRAAAYFRAGDFESAAALWGRISGAGADYNRGVALVMLGRYADAIAAFDAALARRPEWPEAIQNREIARLRLQRLAPPEDDAGGTGGKLGADEIVFDESGRVDKGGSEVQTQGGEELTDEALRAVWLRRSQGDTGDFLRARFAYQLIRENRKDDER
jgi:Ca-activated chloride channel family protein